MSDEAMATPINTAGRLRKTLAAKAAAASTALEIAREIVGDTAPMRLAERYRTARYEHAGADALARYAGDWWRWTDGLYEPVTDEAIAADVRAYLDGLDVVCGEGDTKPLRVTRNLVNEVIAGLLDARRPIVPNGAELPHALAGYHGPRARDCLAVANGVLDVAGGKLGPATPRLFTTTRSDAAYRPDATCPRWDAFLADIFEGDAESIRLLAQWCGYLIAGDTSRQKALLMFGPPRSGKGTIVRVIERLLGRGSVANPTLASLSENFGLATLIGKAAAIVGDARLSYRTDGAIIAERILSITGEDTLTIDRKHRAAVEVRLRARLMIVSNELPAIADASGALASRFCILETRRSYLGAEDRGLEVALAAELPGILNWALAGWRDLETGGRFIEPARAADARAELVALASPIKAFIADVCDVAVGVKVERGRLFEAWKAWCLAEGRQFSGTREHFSRNLRAALPGLSDERHRGDGDRLRYYGGVTLRGGVTL